MITSTAIKNNKHDAPKLRLQTACPIYTRVTSDKKIKRIYKMVDFIEDDPWSTHGLKHINSTVKIAKTLYEMFNPDEFSLDTILTSCYLHDTGAVFGKPNHATHSKIYVEKYLDELNLNNEMKQTIVSTVAHHSSASENAPLIEKYMALADKLDITKSRILKAGKKIEGMRQVSNILSLYFNKTDTLFIVNIRVSLRFNLTEWQNYYFTAKVNKAIEVFAHAYGLEPQIIYSNKQKQLH